MGVDEPTGKEPSIMPTLSPAAHQWLVGLMLAILGSIWGTITVYVQQHPPVTPVVQTAPVVVQKEAPPVMSQEQFNQMLMKWSESQKK
jgi:hypothetical protein